MSEFKREHRYWVFKRKHLSAHDDQSMRLIANQEHMEFDAPPEAAPTCAVVEDDWPEYEIVWQMIQDRMKGRPNIIERLRSERDKHRRNYLEMTAILAGAQSELSTALARVEALEGRLTEIANIAHHGGLIGKDMSDVARITLDFWDRDECSKLQALAREGVDAKPEHQYYYRMNGCPARTSRDANCICWHYEGAGPMKNERHDDLETMVQWRPTRQGGGNG